MTLGERALRPYQAEAVAAVEDEWTRVRSTLLVMATGCGKTFTAAQIVRRARARGRVLWLAHRSELLDQARGDLASAGLATEMEQAEAKAQVHSLFATSDVVIGSVATLHAKRLRRWPANAFSTIVIDEAHHSTSAGYLGILSHFSGAKVLGLTATPDRSDGVGMRNVFDTCAFKIGILDGIRGGFLTPIIGRKIICADLDLSKVRTTAGDLSAGDLEDAMQIEGVLHQIAAPLVAEAGTRQTIAFCPTVAIAEELARVLSGYVGADRVASISGKTERTQRAAILDGYKSGRIQYVTNCMVLTEGFDAPATSCIAMCRPTKSRSLYTQAVGRGLRLSPGKVDCLLLDFIAKNSDPDLVGPIDVLAGADLSPGDRELAERRLTTGGAAEELTGAIEAAKAEGARREARLERERRAASLSAVMRWSRADMQLFPGHVALGEHAASAFKPAAKGERIADADQLARLAAYGMTAPKGVSAASAKAVIDEAMRRGIASMKQLRILQRAGLRLDVTKREASAIIDQLAANNWQCTPELRAQYGRAVAA